MKLDTLGYFTDRKDRLTKRGPRKCWAVLERKRTLVTDQCADPRLLPGHLWLSPFLKSTSKPGPWVRIGEMKHPLLWSVSYFLCLRECLGQLGLLRRFRTKHPDFTCRQALASDTKLKGGSVLQMSERGSNTHVLIHDSWILSYSKCKI